jgi:hypothetical protein
MNAVLQILFQWTREPAPETLMFLEFRDFTISVSRLAAIICTQLTTFGAVRTLFIPNGSRWVRFVWINSNQFNDGGYSSVG